MLTAIALLAVVFGGVLMILGDQHTSGRLVFAGIMLAFSAPLVDAAAGVLLQSLHEHGTALVALLVVLVVGAAAIKVGPRSTSHDKSPSLKKRVDHDH